MIKKLEYLDKRLRVDLDNIKKNLTKKAWDAVVCIEGPEGSGKSSLGLQLCYYVDPNFSTDRIIFKHKDLKRCLRDSVKGGAILIDEAISLFYKRTHARGEQVDSMMTIMRCRRKGQFIVIILPRVSELEGYIREYRLSGVSRIVKRGRVFVYGAVLCKKIYTDKRTRKLIHPKPPSYKFSYRAADKVIKKEWDEYEIKRDSATYDDDDEKQEDISRKVISTTTARKRLDCHINTLYNYIEKGYLEITRFKTGRIGIYEDTLKNVMKG